MLCTITGRSGSTCNSLIGAGQLGSEKNLNFSVLHNGSRPNKPCQETSQLPRLERSSSSTYYFARGVETAVHVHKEQIPRAMDVIPEYSLGSLDIGSRP